jgi:hypothetical protein
VTFKPSRSFLDVGREKRNTKNKRNSICQDPRQEELSILVEQRPLFLKLCTQIEIRRRLNRSLILEWFTTWDLQTPNRLIVSYFFQ